MDARLKPGARSGRAVVLSLVLLGVTSTVLAMGEAAAQAGVEGGDKPAQAGIARGLLLENEGRVFFAPCRDRSYLNVTDTSSGEEVLAALRDFGLAPGRNLYVEFVATHEGGRLYVSSLNFARTAARCLGESANEEQWRALGLQEEWSAVAGEGVLFVMQAGRDEVRSSYAAIDETQARVSIVAQKAVLRLERGLCRLDDGSTLSGWRASLDTAAGERLAGCGWAR